MARRESGGFYSRHRLRAGVPLPRHQDLAAPAHRVVPKGYRAQDIFMAGQNGRGPGDRHRRRLGSRRPHAAFRAGTDPDEPIGRNPRFR